MSTPPQTFNGFYSNAAGVVSYLHENGFSNDFQLVGNELLWVQENIFIRAGDFGILEYHLVSDCQNPFNEIILFGIIAPCHAAKGILLGHYKRYADGIPAIIIRKMNDAGIRCRQFCGVGSA